MSKKSASIVAAAALAALSTTLTYAGVTNGTVGTGEYHTRIGLQNTPTGFGDNYNELNAAYANRFKDGSLELGITANMEQNGNGVIIFLDTRAGGAVSTVLPGPGYGVLGSIGGARIDDWGTDTDGGPGISPTPGGGSIMSPGFNPDIALEINAGGGSGNYYVNVIDLTVANDNLPNRDVFLGSNAYGGASVSQAYNRDTGPRGFVIHAFDNSNTGGVNGFDFGSPPGALGDPAGATKGFEFVLSTDFLNSDGSPIKILAVGTNGDGGYLSNQFLPGLGGATNLGGPGGDGGTPLFDAQLFGDHMYMDVPGINAWNANTNGDWSDNAKWILGAPNYQGDEANFLSVITAPRTITVDAPVTVGLINFDNANAYTVAGSNAVTLKAGIGSAQINIAGTGNPTISAPVILASPLDVKFYGTQTMTLSGALDNSGAYAIKVAGTGSTLNIDGVQTHAVGASLEAQGGTVNFNSNANGNLVINVNEPATVNFNVAQDLGGLNIGGKANIAAGGAKAVKTYGLTIGGPGVLDIKDNSLIVDSASGTTLAYVVGKIQSARNGYDGNVVTNWDGVGITSSSARADSVAAGFDLYSVGAIKNGDLADPNIGRDTYTAFAGQSVSPTNLLVRYTYSGDADLNGFVDGDDYALIDNAFNLLIPNFGWLSGDFNYDGNIDGDDYALIDSGFLFQGAPVPAAASSAVPEPATLGLMGLSVVGLIGRRRR